MKKIDILALLTILFLVINCDQTHLFELNVNESKKNSTVKSLRSQKTLKSFYLKNVFFSSAYCRDLFW